MKVLIIGGAGFIGKWVVEKLPAATEIVIVDSLDGQVHTTLPEFAPEMQNRAVCIKADVRDADTYRDVVKLAFSDSPLLNFLRLG